MRVRLLFRNSSTFLAGIQTMHRMDRGDRIYVKRHFQRWLDAARILENIDSQSGLMRVLDVGCGSGFFMLMFEGSLTGLDNAENVEICRKRGLQAYSIDLEKDRFPFENETFDAAVCLEVLEHLADPKNLLDETYRLLKLGGYFLLSTPNNRMPTWRIRDFLFRFSFVGRIYMSRLLGKDEKRCNKRELGELLGSHNFEIQSFYYPKILLPSDDLLVIARKKS